VGQLSPNQAVVDRDNRTGHIVGQIGRKELDPHFGAILDSPKPPKGDQLGPITVALNAARNNRRHDPPGGDHAVRLALTTKARDPGSDRKARCQRPSYGDDLRGRLPSHDRDDRAKIPITRSSDRTMFIE
jgi:hypothetical protein